MADQRQSGHGSGRGAGDSSPAARGLEGALRAAQLEAEITRLRRENDYLRQQRDILKKTLGILSEAPTNGISGLTR